MRARIAALLAIAALSVASSLTPSDSPAQAAVTIAENAGAIITQVGDDEVVVSGTSSDADPLMIVLDLSGSMRDDDGTGTNKLLAAKAAVERVLRAQGEGSVVGVWGYPGVDDECSSGRAIIPAKPITDLNLAIAMVDTVTANGGTPTGVALTAAVEHLRSQQYTGGTIVLVSDGESNCGSPPCPVARELAATDFNVTVDAVGFQQSEQGRDELTCVAQATGGRYFDAEDSEQLVERLDGLGSANLTVDVTYSTVAQAGGSTRISARIANNSSRDAADVRVNLAFKSAHAGAIMPSVVPPTYRVGGLPAGASRVYTWSVSTGARDSDGEARFRVTAWAPQINAVAVDGAISVTTEGLSKNSLGDLLAGVRDDGHPLVIVGDSYSSGEGTFEYLDDSDPCHQSLKTYAAPLFADDPDGVVVVACSGAVTGNVHTAQHPDDDSKGNRPQRNRLSDVEGAGAVLLTFGGNDIGFAQIIEKCYKLGTCSDDGEWVRHVAESVVGMGTSLAETYRTVWAAANGADDLRARDGAYAPVVVLAYPQIMHDQSRGKCTDFNAKEVAFANALVTALNASSKRAVATARDEGYEVYFAASTQAALLPARTYCAEGDAASVNGLVGTWLSVKQESFHPKVSGYELTTNTLVGWLGSVERVEPTVTAQESEADLLSHVIDSLLTSRSVSLDSPTSAQVVARSTIGATAGGFQAGTPVTFMLRSAPTTLGTWAADEDGRITTELWIPEHIAPGDHTLIAWGEDADGNLIERTVPVRVIASSAGWVPLVALGSVLLLLGAVALVIVWWVRRPRAASGSVIPVHADVPSART